MVLSLLVLQVEDGEIDNKISDHLAGGCINGLKEGHSVSPINIHGTWSTYPFPAWPELNHPLLLSSVTHPTPYTHQHNDNYFQLLNQVLSKYTPEETREFLTKLVKRKLHCHNLYIYRWNFLLVFVLSFYW